MPITSNTPFQEIQGRGYQTHSSAQFFEARDSVGSEALRARFARHEKLVQNLDLLSKQLPNPHRLSGAIMFFQSQNAGLHAIRNGIPNVPKEHLLTILQFLEFQQDHNEKARGQWFHQCLTNPTLPPLTPLIRTIKFFLLPFSGTAFAIRRSGSRTHRRKDLLAEEALEALQNATRVYTLMTKIVQMQKPFLHPGVAKAALTLWKDRCTYFGNLSFSNVPLSPDMIDKAFGGAQGTEACLQEMDRIFDQMDGTLNAVDREASYGFYVAALAASGSKGAANRARQALQRFEDKQKAEFTTIYSATMQVYANEAKFDASVAREARDFWEHVCSLQHLKPSAATFNSLLLTFSHAHQPEEAERMLLYQDENSERQGFQPTRTEYNVVINSWAKNADPGGSKRALSLFHSMVERSHAENRPDLAPDIITYTILIDALARNSNTGEEGLSLAESLLHHCESGKDPNVRVDHTLYRNYMKAMAARLRSQNSSFAKVRIAERLESLLFRMKEMRVKADKSMAGHWHNAQIYGLVIEAWTRTRSQQAPRRALKVYSVLKEECRKAPDSGNLVPDVKIYQDLLSCIGLRGGKIDEDPGLAHHVVSVANSLLNDMQQLGYPLTARTLNLYLRVLSTRRVPEALAEAERQLQALEESYANGVAAVVPNSMSYQVVMEGYSKLPRSAEHAEDLLKRMLALAQRYEERKSSLWPPSACYTIVMDAWSRSQRKDSVENAERIMNEAEKRGVHPSTYMYTTLINAIAHSDHIVDGPERAKEILLKMKADYESGMNPECEPEIATFAALMKCWEMTGRRDAPEQIEAIIMHLHELRSHKQFSNLTLSYSCFRVALSKWAAEASSRADAGDRALKLLSLADEYCEAGKIESFQLRHCYHLAMVTLARSRDSGKALKAYNLLNKMRQRGSNPRAQEFEQVLRACKETGMLEGATDEQKQEALRIANLAFREFRESRLQPDECVYKEMIDLHRTLLGGEHQQEAREKLVQSVFCNAPDTIQRSKAIHIALKEVLSGPSCRELVEMSS